MQDLPLYLIWVLDGQWECEGMGKRKRAGRGKTLMLCVNAEDCGRKKVQGTESGMGKESIMGCEARKVKGGNYKTF